jgi:uncharacterized protein
MGGETEGRVVYFQEKGPDNTDRALDIALEASRERNISRIVVASSTGSTALRLRKKAGASLEMIAVTYCAGSSYAEEVEEFNRNRERIEEEGIHIVRGLHALSGTERAFEHRYKTALMPLNIVADTLRMFCHGVKVCVEISIMAAEHGFLAVDEDVVAVAGSGHGADTALVLRPAYAARMFETRIRALLCMPA